MILSFSEFNSLYESYDDNNANVYCDGIEVMESLLTVMNKKGVLTESEVVTFLDNVLEETGWELNEEVYESYAEWLTDWTPFFDEGINEDESELIFALTQRGEKLLEEGLIRGTYQHSKEYLAKAKKGLMGGVKTISGGVKDLGARFGANLSKKLAGTQSGRMKNMGAAISKTWKDSSKGQKIGIGIAAGAALAGAGYGIYRGIKALKQRKANKQAQVIKQK